MRTQPESSSPVQIWMKNKNNVDTYHEGENPWIIHVHKKNHTKQKGNVIYTRGPFY